VIRLFNVEYKVTESSGMKKIVESEVVATFIDPSENAKIGAAMIMR
jgi:hypothetical protein